MSDCQPDQRPADAITRARAILANGGDSHLPTNAETRLVLADVLAELEAAERARAELEAELIDVEVDRRYQQDRAREAERRAAELEAQLRDERDDVLKADTRRIEAERRADTLAEALTDALASGVVGEPAAEWLREALSSPVPPQEPR